MIAFVDAGVFFSLYLFQAYHDNYDPKESEFYVVDDRPTLLNITLQRNSVIATL